MASLRLLADQGQSVWVDYLSRPMLRSGELAELVDAGVTGVTSNPTTFKKAIADGDAYDDSLREVLREYTEPKEIFLALAKNDIRQACDLLRPLFDRAGQDYHGWVSLEVDPRHAYDTQATIDEAVSLHRMIDRPNLFVKIPGTREGLPAIEEAVARGIPVNVTLLFSLERHRAAAEAYLRGLRKLRDRGGELRSVGSVASFFVSRVDAEADRRLAELGMGGSLTGTLAVANAKLAYQTYLDVFRGPEWEELAAAGAKPQQCLWASTSPKSPDLPDVYYVEQLIGPDTVDTMPRQTIADFRDHGTVARTVDAGVEQAQHTFEEFARSGVDYDSVTAELEREGVEAFAESFRELFDGIASKRDSMLERRP